ncbi:MAG: hypothetical protein JOZ38_07425 [Candidatus Eremiobacteraeota bacterium]|nr:hypothetical protein [Candidatus Eremiobacteraeota bacterium]
MTSTQGPIGEVPARDDAHAAAISELRQLKSSLAELAQNETRLIAEQMTAALRARDERIQRLQHEIVDLQCINAKRQAMIDRVSNEAQIRDASIAQLTATLEQKNRYIARLVSVRMVLISVGERFLGRRPSSDYRNSIE